MPRRVGTKRQIEWASKLVDCGWVLKAPTVEKKFGSVSVVHTIDSDATFFESENILELDKNKMALNREGMIDLIAALQFVVDNGKEIKETEGEENEVHEQV